MCSHYEAPTSEALLDVPFGVEPARGVTRTDIWPGYESVFIRRQVDCPRRVEREAVRGVFGLIPHWAQDVKLAKRTYNARSETVAEKPSFRDSWLQAKHCIVPLAAFYEPDWRSGKAVATRISRVDGQPMGLAGLWSSWKSPDNDLLHSFTMLTINADSHPFMQNFHKPDDEKRMVVVLPEDRFDDWLSAPAENSMEFLRPFHASEMKAEQPTPDAGTLGLW